MEGEIPGELPDCAVRDVLLERGTKNVRLACRGARSHPAGMVLSSMSLEMPALLGEALPRCPSLVISTRAPAEAVVDCLERHCQSGSLLAVAISNLPHPSAPRHAMFWDEASYEWFHEVRPEVLRALPPSVTSLTLRCRVNPRRQGWETPLQHLNLAQLDLSRITHLGSDEEWLVRFLLGSPHSVRLQKLCGVRWDRGYAVFTRLKHLELQRLLGEHLESLQTLPALEVLKTREYDFTRDWGRLGGMTRLRALHLLRQWSLGGPVASLPEHLEELVLGDVELLPPPTTCGCMRSLAISDPRGFRPPAGLAQLEVRFFRACAPLLLPTSLQSLCLRDVSPEVVPAVLARVRRMEHLVELHLFLSDRAELPLASISSRLPRIRTLGLECCNVPDPDWLGNMPELRHLYLGRCSLRTPHGDLSCLQRCSQLETLELLECDSYTRTRRGTRSAIGRLAALPQVRSLAITHVPGSLTDDLHARLPASSEFLAGFTSLSVLIFQGRLDVAHLSGVRNKLEVLWAYCYDMDTAGELGGFPRLWELGVICSLRQMVAIGVPASPSGSKMHDPPALRGSSREFQVEHKY